MKGFIPKQTVVRTIMGLLLILPLLLVQCKRKSDLDLSLAVNSNELHLEALEGKTHIMVYANGDWKVAFKEDADWISVNKLSGSGNADITFSYSQNFGASRSVMMILTKGSEVKEIQIIQKGLDVALRFAKTKFAIPKHALPTILPVTSNLKHELKTVKIDYLYDDETSEKWVRNAQLIDEGFVFDALENNSGRKRSVRIYLTLIDAFNNEYASFTDVEQSLTVASLSQKFNTESNLTRSAKIDTVILKGNVGVHFPLVEISTTYEQDNGWIEDIRLANDSLLIMAVRENNTGGERRATVRLQLSINGMSLVDMSHKVIQSPNDFEVISFESIRNMISGISGTVTMNAPLKVLEGIVISDEGNANMETNPNLTYNSMDLSETYKTAYIQSLDGKYGFRLKFAVQSENTLKRYSKVYIVVNGLSLQKEANPGRYTIRNVRTSAIAKIEAGTSVNVVNKQKYVSELKDEDMYTQVILRDVAIAVPYGSYMNVNVGYTLKTNWSTQGTASPYSDATPTRVFDGEGNSMNILVNASAPWARSIVPQGAGTIGGVLTHSKLIRYGSGEGDIGKYSLRPVDLTSIQLNNSSIAKTLVEWNWMPNGGTNTGANGIINQDADGVKPLIGSGRLTSTVVGAVPSVGMHPVYHTDPTSKTIYNNGLQYTGVKWWNTTLNKGEGFLFKFPTTGISAKALVMNFTIGGGSGADATNGIPVYWEVEYSLDGVNYTILPNSTFGVRPLVQWATDRPFQSVGLVPLSFSLPTTLLGKADVYVKIRAKNNICATGASTGAENGTITSTAAGTTMRLGVVSIKYIQ